MRSSESDLLDQRRLVLTLDHNGMVLSVNNAAPKTLFGFSPLDAVGSSLSTFVNVFDEWQQKGKNLADLLSLLANHEQVCGCM